MTARPGPTASIVSMITDGHYRRATLRALSLPAPNRPGGPHRRLTARLNDRLKQLEDKIAPKGRHLVFVHFEEPDAPPRNELLAAFKAEHSIGPGDIIHEVQVAFS
jgi:hypothetical protein